MNLTIDEVIKTGEGVIQLASQLPQVPLDFSSTKENEDTVNSIVDELSVLRSEWMAIVPDDQCPKCGEKIAQKTISRWLVLNKVIYECEACGYSADSKEEHEKQRAIMITETKGVAAAKFIALASRLVSEIGISLESSSSSLVCHNVESLILKSGEMVILSVPAILLTERAVRHTQTRQTSSPNRTYLGGSFRISKGAYLHLGGSVGAQRQSESISASVAELFPKDWGVFVLTNFRATFIGDNLATSSIDLGKLISASVAQGEDGRQVIMLQVANRQRPLIFDLQDSAFQPAGVPWPLVHPQLGINATTIVSMVKRAAINS